MKACRATVDRNPYKAKDVETLIGAWLPLTFAVNSLNRSMGQPDLYPFVISAPAVAKLQYIHDLVTGSCPSAPTRRFRRPRRRNEASEHAARPHYGKSFPPSPAVCSAVRRTVRPPSQSASSAPAAPLIRPQSSSRTNNSRRANGVRTSKLSSCCIIEGQGLQRARARFHRVGAPSVGRYPGEH